MTTVLCTLYNSLYLDKGLVLYDSLCECSEDFKLYVLCMDEKCYEVLRDMHQKHQIPVRLSDFENGDNELLKAKSNRPMSEYCWTCSSSFIMYVLCHFKEPICTYIDADMYFYTDPQILIKEMMESGKSVIVIPHRFPTNKVSLAKKVGLYCVEFNTFLNNPYGMEVLEYWRKRCLECCENRGDGIHWGDQKYLEELVEKYDCVHVCNNLGAGVAPWNIDKYKNPLSKNLRIILCKDNNNEIPLIFYHFQSVRYLTRQLIDTNIKTTSNIDLSLVDNLYCPYLKMIETKKKLLENKYGLSFLIKHHPSDKKVPIWKVILFYIHPKRIYKRIRLKIRNIQPYLIDISNEQ